MNALAIVDYDGELSQTVERARAYADSAMSDNTRAAYRHDLAAWFKWCQASNYDATAPNAVIIALYLSDIAPKLCVSTLARRIAGINSYLRTSGKPSVSLRVEPLKSVWSGIQKTHGKPQRRVKPITTSLLRDVITPISHDVKGLRDRALLLLGFAGAMRRADLSGLDFGAGQGGNGFVSVEREGLKVHFIRSKTNQTGMTENIGIAYGSNPLTCPVRAFQEWQESIGGLSASGPVFRGVNRHGHISAKRLNTDSIGRIIKARVYSCLVGQGVSDLDALDAVKGFSGHSLRAGFVTSAFERAIPESAIMPHTRHKKTETLYKYRRPATLFKDNPSAKVGL